MNKPHPPGRAPGPIWLWEVSGRRWMMKPSIFRSNTGVEVMVGPIQLIRDDWGMRIHVTWPLLHTFTLAGVRENCGRSVYHDELA
jgi:hypothetical protein